ncbi:MAG: hypothetical protein LBK97_02690 [Prevotellaceae bacterium]|jgi:hypothetical protein|nr:hypothetical protein [Prevotellaceae bacterium]
MQHSLYTSPLTLLDWKSGELPKVIDIRRVRNRRLAELETSGGISFSINGQEYSRNDIVNIFDGMISDTSLPYHLQVSHDASLLRFLETGYYSPQHPFLTDTHPDEPFMEWLQPHFASAFAVLLKYSLETENAQSIADLLRETVKPDGRHESTAWEPLYTELLKASAAMELISSSGISYDTAESVLSLAGVTFLQLLSLKPDGLFYDEVYEYMRLLYNCIYRYSHTSRVYCVFHNLLNINFEGTLRTRCEEELKSYSGTAFYSLKTTGIPGEWLASFGETETREGKIKLSLNTNRRIDCKEGLRLGFAAIIVIICLILVIFGNGEYKRYKPKHTIETKMDRESKKAMKKIMDNFDDIKNNRLKKIRDSLDQAKQKKSAGSKSAPNNKPNEQNK